MNLQDIVERYGNTIQLTLSGVLAGFEVPVSFDFLWSGILGCTFKDVRSETIYESGKVARCKLDCKDDIETELAITRLDENTTRVSLVPGHAVGQTANMLDIGIANAENPHRGKVAGFLCQSIFLAFLDKERQPQILAGNKGKQEESPIKDRDFVETRHVFSLPLIDVLQFLGWLWNWVEGKHRMTFYSNYPAFGNPKDGDYIIHSLKRRPDGGIIPVDIMDHGKFRNTEININLIPNEGEISVEIYYPEELTDFMMELLIAIHKKFPNKPQKTLESIVNPMPEEKQESQQQTKTNDKNLNDLSSLLRGTQLAEFEITLPWQPLHNATIENLPGYAPGVVEFTPIIISPGLSRFVLKNRELGSHGEITLREISTNSTVMTIYDPPKPSWDETNPNWKKQYFEPEGIYVRDLNDMEVLQEPSPIPLTDDAKQQKFQKILEAQRKIEAEVEMLFQKRKDLFHGIVLRAYFNRLVHDYPLWINNQVIPPDYLVAWAGLKNWPDFRNMSIEGREYFEKKVQEIRGRKDGGIFMAEKQTKIFMSGKNFRQPIDVIDGNTQQSLQADEIIDPFSLKPLEESFGFTFRREQTTLGTVEYTLCNMTGKEFGNITLTKLSENCTAVFFGLTAGREELRIQRWKLMEGIRDRLYKLIDNTAEYAKFMKQAAEKPKEPTLEIVAQPTLKDNNPTIRTQERFKIFEFLKRTHPGWSYERVAIEANLQEKTESYTGETVRNTYKLMGKKWERADRIR